jgi:hypothetical protein
MCQLQNSAQVFNSFHLLHVQTAYHHLTYLTFQATSLPLSEGQAGAAWEPFGTVNFCLFL